MFSFLRMQRIVAQSDRKQGAAVARPPWAFVLCWYLVAGLGVPAPSLPVLQGGGGGGGPNLCKQASMMLEPCYAMLSNTAC